MKAQPPNDAEKPLLVAHRLAVEGEDLYEEGRLREAAQRFEAASEFYVRATLQCTKDTVALQSLRQLKDMVEQVSADDELPECGISFEDFQGMEADDRVEAYAARESAGDEE